MYIYNKIYMLLYLYIYVCCYIHNNNNLFEN